MLPSLDLPCADPPYKKVKLETHALHHTPRPLFGCDYRSSNCYVSSSESEVDYSDNTPISTARQTFLIPSLPRLALDGSTLDERHSFSDQQSTRTVSSESEDDEHDFEDARKSGGGTVPKRLSTDSREVDLWSARPHYRKCPESTDEPDLKMSEGEHRRNERTKNCFICCEIIPGEVYLSGDKIPSSKDLLRKNGITHIVNSAGDICPNYFEDEFTYLTFYLKDDKQEEISAVFYRSFDFIEKAIRENGRVLIHCREGISRSCTLAIAFLMHRSREDTRTTFNKIIHKRSICNPNPGFYCQLLDLEKRLLISGSCVPRLFVYRVSLHDARTSFLVLRSVDYPRKVDSVPYDSRFGFVLRKGGKLLGWIGKQCANQEMVKDTIRQFVQDVRNYEDVELDTTIVQEGDETPLFHEWSGNFTVENRPEFDEDARISSQDLPCKPERRDPEGTDTLEDLHFSVSPASKEIFSPISMQNSAKDRSFECLPFSATRSECRFLVSPPSHAVSYTPAEYERREVSSLRLPLFPMMSETPDACRRRSISPQLTPSCASLTPHASPKSETRHLYFPDSFGFGTPSPMLKVPPNTPSTTSPAFKVPPNSPSTNADADGSWESGSWTPLNRRRSSASLQELLNPVLHSREPEVECRPWMVLLGKWTLLGSVAVLSASCSMGFFE